MTLPHFRNLHPAERIVRVLLGLVMLGLGAADALPGLGSIAALLLGWAPLVTGLVGWCPFHAVLRAGDAHHRL